MSTTTFLPGNPTLTIDGSPNVSCPDELMDRYQSVLADQRLNWTEHLRLTRRLGSGGQGVVYLSERRGTDGFTLPVALKIFSPARYENARAYDEAMSRIAHVGAKVAQIQQDNLLDVQNFVDRNRIRIMEMEWVDGYDLNRLLTKQMINRTQERVSNRRWEYLNNVIVTAGPLQPRLKPGPAIAIVRECLAALAALHRDGIVHSDIKPSNIMLKRTGNAKIVDIGSAFELTNQPIPRTCTPQYAAPEVLEGGECSARSDLASLGYVLIEMLAGVPPFVGLTNYRDLLEAKRSVPQRLHQMLPQEVVCNELLMNFCRGMIAPDPMRRFPSAEAADLVKEGAASFLRQLVKGDLASEYENEIRLWLEELD
jgi:serine/threonine protein kinase